MPEHRPSHPQTLDRASKGSVEAPSRVDRAYTEPRRSIERLGRGSVDFLPTEGQPSHDPAPSRLRRGSVDEVHTAQQRCGTSCAQASIVDSSLAMQRRHHWSAPSYLPTEPSTEPRPSPRRLRRGSVDEVHAAKQRCGTSSAQSSIVDSSLAMQRHHHRSAPSYLPTEPSTGPRPSLLQGAPSRLG